MATCRDCGAECQWAKTQNGKNILLDAEPHPEGKFLVEPIEGTSDQRAIYLGDISAVKGRRFFCHWKGCATPSQREPK